MSNANASSLNNRGLSEKIEPYLSFLGPMAMIAALLLFMGIVEPARYFRLVLLLRFQRSSWHF